MKFENANAHLQKVHGIDETQQMEIESRRTHHRIFHVKSRIGNDNCT